MYFLKRWHSACVRGHYSNPSLQYMIIRRVPRTIKTKRMLEINMSHVLICKTEFGGCGYKVTDIPHSAEPWCGSWRSDREYDC